MSHIWDKGEEVEEGHLPTFQSVQVSSLAWVTTSYYFQPIGPSCFVAPSQPNQEFPLIISHLFLSRTTHKMVISPFLETVIHSPLPLYNTSCSISSRNCFHIWIIFNRNVFSQIGWKIVTRISGVCFLNIRNSLSGNFFLSCGFSLVPRCQRVPNSKDWWEKQRVVKKLENLQWSPLLRGVTEGNINENREKWFARNKQNQNALNVLHWVAGKLGSSTYLSHSW